MQRLLNWPIASRNAPDLTAEDYADHVRMRRESGVSAATVVNDMTWIKQVIDVARTLWGIKIDPQALDDARTQMRRLGWAKKSHHRTRRPTSDEIDRIMAFYRSAEDRMLLPMTEIVAFALASCRRVDEITRLRWSDLDEEKRICTVRDVKHPTDKAGNDLVFRVTPEALAIMLRQPRTDERIFPYNSRSISGSFWRTCKLLGIDGLRFHDLRREAVSRLFEKGYAIHEVALFSLHQSWQSLKIYTQLRPEDLIDR